MTPRLHRLFWIAHYRVTTGFIVAALAFWLATPRWSSFLIGSFIAAVGELLRIWAAGHLRKGQELTQSGPYRFFRHPLYIGSCVIGIGFTVVASHLLVTLLVLCYLVVTLLAATQLEEETLRNAFGEDYEKYVHGERSLSTRRFSLSRMVENGEHRSLFGFAAALAVLALKVWL
jgi:protein-S-isoprenylcysteine O-methyltransferase Ste14